ncbi:cytochrome P450 [Candidatus Poriferisocius sp.]|uniref:cytochrome P450 n=1 Tax=Candidatus Poriferisocius sp. TaxID=3101276 RepID=UPI003B011AE2
MTLNPGDINLAKQDDIARFGAAPYEYFEVLRREAPVWWNPPPEPQNPGYLPCPGFWVLSKYEDVAMASKDHERFSAWENSVLWTDVRRDPAQLASQRAGLMGMDPPQHTQFRRLIQPGLTPRKVANLESFIREHAQEVIGELAGKDQVEFVFDVAAELPMILLCQLMGVPQHRRDEYMQLGNKVASFEHNPEFQNDIVALYLFLDDVVKSRGDAQDDTMLSKYLHGEVDGRRLAKDEITQFFVTLSIAGHETTRNTTAHFVRLMDEHPDQKERLLDDIEGRMPNAIEEVLRFSPPVMQFCRTATCDIELRGVTIPKDSKVYLSYISANRDEEVFDNPDRFDIGRSNADTHLAFGTGPHFCLGAALARTQLRCVLEELYRRLPDIELAGSPEPMNSVWFNGINAMPLNVCPVSSHL